MTFPASAGSWADLLVVGVPGSCPDHIENLEGGHFAAFELNGEREAMFQAGNAPPVTDVEEVCGNVKRLLAPAA